MLLTKPCLKKSLFRYTAAIFGLAVFSIFIFLPILAAETPPCVPNPNAVILNIPIPGMPLVYNAGCGTYEFTGAEGGSLLVDYIKYLYKFLVGIAGILAVFMIMYGGTQWIFSGGNPSKITAAKETIFGAVIGLFLAVGSYTLLRTINPSLVSLSLKVPSIKVVGAFYNEDGSCKDAKDIPCGFLCTPISGSGASVMGECKWCSPDSAGTCGRVGGKDENGRTVDITVPASEGNCWYARCGSSKACTYVSEPMEGVSVYHPQCQSSLSIKINDSSNEFYFNDSYLFGGIDRLWQDFSCGKIYLSTDYSITFEKNFNYFRTIGTSCPNGASCVIDISKGYTITSPTPNQFPVIVIYKKEIGYFNNWECIPSSVPGKSIFGGGA